MSDHFYDPITKEARHFIEKKNGAGLRPTTVVDARKHGYYPSVTTILKAADKPALTKWLCRNAATAALTTPRLSGEDLDAFLERILSRDAVDESDKAKDLGTQVHDAIECSLTGKPFNPDLLKYVEPVVNETNQFGQMVMCETVVIGDRYAGKMDSLFQDIGLLTVLDFKTCKKLPKKSWFEHQCQLGAYALTLGNTGSDRIQTANIYISTTEPGQVLTCINKDWERPAKAFLALAEYWRLVNGYDVAPRPETMTEMEPIDVPML